MSIKTGIVRAAASIGINKLNKAESKPIENQNAIFQKLIQKGQKTKFGKEHKFDEIKSYKDFIDRVPVRDYEGLKTYFDAIKSGAKDILWPGKPKYLAKTSGTTSGTKYIPITKQSLPNHIESGKNALFSYLNQSPLTRIFDGRMLFLSGTPELDKENGILIGRLSGIVNHEVPAWIVKTLLPSRTVNIIEPWEAKVHAMVEELLKKDLRVISGIPPWVQMLCEKIIELSGKSTVIEQFPNLELYIHGGVNYEPYRERINSLIGKELALIETYPASEGFIAFQDNNNFDGLRIISNSGIFYEFIPKEEINKPNPIRLRLQEVELNKDYAIVLSSNAGLWAYIIGDLVRFVSLNPYRLKVTGRTAQFISAFGEHVIASEIEKALSIAIQKFELNVVEFLVAPQVNPENDSLPYHEWFIEFKELPEDLNEISSTIDQALCELNSYYNDLIKNKILRTLKITPIKSNGFKEYMISVNKYGEQFKVTRVCNDRVIADQLYSKRLNK
ncbi:MAG: GH3 auxin-responsive promoter family protein [Saprospiraceae bacterium]